MENRIKCLSEIMSVLMQGVECDYGDRYVDGHNAASDVREECVYFFFQAEDGIRDGRVTGVQTCALPISPENVESLTAAVMTELDRLRREGPSAADVQAVKEQEKNTLQESLLQNGYWLNSLQAMHLLGRDPRRILQRMERAESLSVENIHAAIRKYFPVDRRTVVTLMPENQAVRTQ